jgi:hypothetical protein
MSQSHRGNASSRGNSSRGNSSRGNSSRGNSSRGNSSRGRGGFSARRTEPSGYGAAAPPPAAPTAPSPAAHPDRPILVPRGPRGAGTNNGRGTGNNARPPHPGAGNDTRLSHSGAGYGIRPSHPGAGNDTRLSHPGQQTLETLKFRVDQYYPPANHVDQATIRQDCGHNLRYPRCINCGGLKGRECTRTIWTECDAACMHCSEHHHAAVCPRLYCSQSWFSKHYGVIPNEVDNKHRRPTLEEVNILVRSGYSEIAAMAPPIVPNSNQAHFQTRQRRDEQAESTQSQGQKRKAEPAELSEEQIQRIKRQATTRKIADLSAALAQTREELAAAQETIRDHEGERMKWKAITTMILGVDPTATSTANSTANSTVDKPFDIEAERRKWNATNTMLGDGQTADTPIDEAAEEEAHWVANKRYDDDSAEGEGDQRK